MSQNIQQYRAARETKSPAPTQLVITKMNNAGKETHRCDGTRGQPQPKQSIITRKTLPGTIDHPINKSV